MDDPSMMARPPMMGDPSMMARPPMMGDPSMMARPPMMADPSMMARPPQAQMDPAMMAAGRGGPSLASQPGGKPQVIPHPNPKSTE